MLLHVGTSGFSYKEWKGSFYPEDLPQKQYLSYYASRFSTVEINNTFYRMPTPSMLEGWTTQVPETFRFVLKAPQRITHQKKLVDAGDDVTRLVEASAALGPHLGPILFQLPPYLRRDDARLAAFLETVPGQTLFAFEFRHESWRDPGVEEILRRRNAAVCIAETDEERTEELTDGSADWGYLRLRRTEYENDELTRWAARIASRNWQEAWLFFKHEDEGKGPAFAEEFTPLAARAGIEVA
jgi:uncharacterized protein YecE (DUF72 family)